MRDLTLETERLVLTPPRLVDFEERHLLFSDPELLRFIGGKVATREETWIRLLGYIGHWDAFGYGIFTVREKAGMAHVGEVGLSHFQRGLGAVFDPFPEASWILAGRWQGRGLAAEAVATVLDWMEREKGARHTVCIIRPDNLASVGLAERLGYRAFGQAVYREAPTTLFERQSLLP